MDSIYLDHNATTPLAPEVAAAIDQTYRAGLTNPASQHEPGRRARRVLEEAREQVLNSFSCRTGTNADIALFTSGGTEANNLAIRGIAAALRGEGPPGRILVSSIEHPCVADSARSLATQGWQVEQIAVRRDGIIDLNHLQERLDTGRVDLVSVMAANNETGIIQPLEQIVTLCQQAGVRVHSDAVQMAGKMPLSFQNLGLDAMTISAHKLNGPAGAGALLVRGDLPIRPILFGGHQQAGLRPGTEGVAMAVGLSRALSLWEQSRSQWAENMRLRRIQLEEGLIKIWPQAVIIGGEVDRLPNTLAMAFADHDRQQLQMALDLAGVACSTGSACASGSSEPSPVLAAMQCPRSLSLGTLRFSTGYQTTEAEISEALLRISNCFNSL